MSTEKECSFLEKSVLDLDKKIDDVHRDVHKHLREVRSDLSDHIETQEGWHSRMIESQQLNTDSINRLTSSTEGLIAAWNTAAGGVKAISIVGRVIKWTAGVIIAVFSVWAYLVGLFK